MQSLSTNYFQRKVAKGQHDPDTPYLMINPTAFESIYINSKTTLPPDKTILLPSIFSCQTYSSLSKKTKIPTANNIKTLCSFLPDCNILVR